MVRPVDLGEVVLQSKPIVTQKWGRMHLIRLKERPIATTSDRLDMGHDSGRQDGE